MPEPDVLLLFGADLTAVQRQLDELRRNLNITISMPAGAGDIVDQFGRVTTAAAGVQRSLNDVSSAAETSGRRTSESADAAANALTRMGQRAAAAFDTASASITRQSATMEAFFRLIGSNPAPDQLASQINTIILANERLMAGIPLTSAEWARVVTQMQTVTRSYTEASVATDNLTRMGQRAAAAFESFGATIERQGGALDKFSARLTTMRVPAGFDAELQRIQAAIERLNTGLPLNADEWARVARDMGTVSTAAATTTRSLRDLETQSQRTAAQQTRDAAAVATQMRALETAISQIQKMGAIVPSSVTAGLDQLRQGSVLAADQMANLRLEVARATQAHESHAAGVSGFIDKLGSATSVVIRYGLAWRALNLALEIPAQFVEIDRQVTLLSATLVDQSDRTQQLKSSYGLMKVAMTEFGLSAEKAGGLVFELQKALESSEERAAALQPAIALTTLKEVDQQQAVRVLIGLYRLYGDSMTDAATPAEKFLRISDEIIKASFLSVGSIRGLSEGLQFMAAQGRAGGVELSEALTMLTLLNDALVKDGRSGTEMSRVLQQLQTDGAKLAAGFGITNFTLDNQVNVMVLLRQVIQKVREEMADAGGMTGSLAAKLKEFFTTIQSQRAMEFLIEGFSQFDDRNKKVHDGLGITNKVLAELKTSVSSSAAALGNELLIQLDRLFSVLANADPGKMEGIAGALRRLADDAKRLGDALERAIQFAKGDWGPLVRWWTGGGAPPSPTAPTGGQPKYVDPFTGKTYDDIPPGAVRRDSGMATAAPYDPGQWPSPPAVDTGGPDRRMAKYNEVVARQRNLETIDDPRRAYEDRIKAAEAEAKRLDDILVGQKDDLKEGRAITQPGGAVVGGSDADRIKAVADTERQARVAKDKVAQLRKADLEEEAKVGIKQLQEAQKQKDERLKFMTELQKKMKDVEATGLQQRLDLIDIETQAEVDKVDKVARTTQEAEDLTQKIVAHGELRKAEERRKFDDEWQKAVGKRVHEELVAADTATEGVQRTYQEHYAQLDADRANEFISRQLFDRRVLQLDVIRAAALDAATLKEIEEKQGIARAMGDFVAVFELGVQKQMVASAQLMPQIEALADSTGKLRAENDAAAAATGLVGLEATKATIAYQLFKKAYDALAPAQQTSIDLAVEEIKRKTIQAETSALVVAGLDREKAAAIATANIKISSREAELDKSIKALETYTGSTQREAEKQARIDQLQEQERGNVVGFFIKGLERQAIAAGDYYGNLDSLSKSTFQNMRSTMSDVFFDLFTQKTIDSQKVFQGFMNSMARAVSDFLASQAITALLSFGKKIGSSVGGLLGDLVNDLFKGASTGGLVSELGPPGPGDTVPVLMRPDEMVLSPEQTGFLRRFFSSEVSEDIFGDQRFLMGSGALGAAFPGLADFAMNYSLAGGGLSGISAGLFGLSKSQVAEVNRLAMDLDPNMLAPFTTVGTPGILGAGGLEASAGDLTGGVLAIGSLLLSMFGGTGGQIAGLVLSLLSPVISALVQAAVTAAVTAATVTLAESLSGSAFTLVLAIPGFLDALASLDEMPSVIRRIKRESTGNALAGGLATIAANVHSVDELVAALPAQIGGGTFGDALAAMLKFNLGGGWFTDTIHNWLPNLALTPLLNFLNTMGYTGSREPSVKDVGGVGEIVAGHVDDFEDILRRFTSMITGTPLGAIPVTSAARRMQQVFDPNRVRLETISTGEASIVLSSPDPGLRDETIEEMLRRLGLGTFEAIMTPGGITLAQHLLSTGAIHSFGSFADALLQSSPGYFASISGGYSFFSQGGQVQGYGIGDSVPAMLEPKEFVIQNPWSDMYASELMHLNRTGRWPNSDREMGGHGVNVEKGGSLMTIQATGGEMDSQRFWDRRAKMLSNALDREHRLRRR